jgi:hypothetical protein
MSIIVRTYTPEGFVVASDGRETAAEDNSVITEERQKIFPIVSPHGSLALSICGTVRIPSDDHSRIAVDITREAIESIESIKNRRSKNLCGLATRLSRPIFTAMRRVVETGEITRYPTSFDPVEGERGSTIARLALDGFYNGYASAASIRYFHEDGVLGEPEILPEPLHPGSHRGYGSPVIGRVLFDPDDERLDVFRNSKIFEHRGSFMYTDQIDLKAAIERSRRYIQACSHHPEAIELDKRCIMIGGKIQIATITRESGFQWLPGYEPGDTMSSMKLITGLWADNPDDPLRVAVTRNTSTFDPTGVVGYITHDDDGHWRIEKDQQDRAFPNLYLAAAELIASLPS